MINLLFGLHDREGRHYVPAGGWIVDTVALSDNPAPMDYAAMRGDINWIVRLNWGYGSTGTIPLPDQYQEFANRCADYIAASKGCDTWIIGNEPNHSSERPDGQPITPVMYIDCFKRVHSAVRLKAGTRHGLIPAPVALWNVETGDWLQYQEAIWRGLWQLSAGVTLHTYTHGTSPQLITSPEKMGAPYHDRFYHFLAYRDLMIRVPVEMRGLPAYITETDQNDPWADTNSGWVQEAYAEIVRWNTVDVTQKIHCLVLYRWPKYDRWYIEDKQGVINDFNEAVRRGYQSPSVTGASVVTETFLPSVPNQSTSAPDLPLEWDSRLDGRGVQVVDTAVSPGQSYWELVKARWWDEKESQGRHHIYVETLDENGRPLADVPFTVMWPNGMERKLTNGKSGFDAGNFPMSKSLNEFKVSIGDGMASDLVTGIGMGANGNSGIHTSTGLTFQRVKAQQATQPTEPTTPPVTPPTGDNFERAMEFIRAWEGGYVDNPNDPGGATNKGITIGTFTRWREHKGLPAPTKDDLRNLTDAEAHEIYRKWYWEASGADKLPWPLALAQMDTAVNAGVNRAHEMLGKSNGNFLLYMGELIDWYTRIPNFEHFGRAWIRRRADLLKEAAA